MIEYSVLCQAIDDWKRGQRPASGPHPSASASGESFDMVEEMNSGIVMLDDSEGSGSEYSHAPGEADAVQGDGQVEGGDAYQGETAYSAAGDQAYSSDAEQAPESEPGAYEAAEEQDVPMETNGDDDENGIPMDTAPESKPASD